MNERAHSAALDGLFAVVVNWNGGAEENLRCVRSLREQGLAVDRIVVVDNASTDGSREALHAELPGLVRVDNDRNLGFGEGANQGAREALERGARALVFVNNDLRFPVDEPVLAKLAGAVAADPGLGLVGPRVLFDDGSERVWCAGGRLDFRQNLSTLLGNGQPDGERWRRAAAVDYVPGCALCLSADTARALAPQGAVFRADYFAYMEDVELGQRARAAGLTVRILGECRAYHAPSSATGGGYSARRKWMQALNSVRFLKENGSAGRWARFALFDVATLPLLLLLRAPRGDARAVLAKAKGLLDGFLGRRVRAEALEPGASWLWPTDG